MLDDEPTWALAIITILTGLLFIVCVWWTISWHGLQGTRGLVRLRGEYPWHLSLGCSLFVGALFLWFAWKLWRELRP